jgi:hypothetical protein
VSAPSPDQPTIRLVDGTGCGCAPRSADRAVRCSSSPGWGQPGPCRAVRAGADRPRRAGHQLRRPRRRAVHGLPVAAADARRGADRGPDAAGARLRPGRRAGHLPRRRHSPAAGLAGAAPGTAAGAGRHRARSRRRARVAADAAGAGDAAALLPARLLPAHRRVDLRRRGAPRPGRAAGWLGRAVRRATLDPRLPRPALCDQRVDQPAVARQAAAADPGAGRGRRPDRAAGQRTHLACRIPHARLHVVRGGGHLFLLERLAALVAGYLRGGELQADGAGAGAG